MHKALVDLIGMVVGYVLAAVVIFGSIALSTRRRK